MATKNYKLKEMAGEVKVPKKALWELKHKSGR